MVGDDMSGPDTDETPVEGTQWTMPWEWTSEQRDKAGIRRTQPRPLRAAWKAKLDEAESHG